MKGFSLIELIIVIVVISLLAIVALPRYIDIAAEAKKSSIEGVSAGFAAGVIGARSQWEVRKRPKMVSDQAQLGKKHSSYNQIVYDGVGFWLTDNSAAGLDDYTNGYPMTISDNSRPYTSQLKDNDCVLLMQNLLQIPPLVFAVGSSDDKVKDARYLAKADSNSCIYFQQEGEAHSFTYETKTGRVTVDLQ